MRTRPVIGLRPGFPRQAEPTAQKDNVPYPLFVRCREPAVGEVGLMDKLRYGGKSPEMEIPLFQGAEEDENRPHVPCARPEVNPTPCPKQ